MNRVSFKDEKFFNSQGVDISNNLPNMLSNWCSIALLIFILMFFIGVTPFNSFNFVWNNAIGTIFTIIICYFIYKDYPMSILINGQAWEQKLKVFGFKPRMCCCTPYIPKSKPVDLLNDPEYSGFSSNTNNYHHWHRH